MPGQAERKKNIRQKYSPLELEFAEKNILLAEDSIVRGNTAAKIVEMIREAGAKKVYLASCAPELRYPCPYGVDMPTRREFIANNLDLEGIRRLLNVDGLFYATLADLIASVSRDSVKFFCAACFTGQYPTSEITKKYLQDMETCRSDEAKNLDEEDGLASFF